MEVLSICIDYLPPTFRQLLNSLPPEWGLVVLDEFLDHNFDFITVVEHYILECILHGGKQVVVGRREVR